VRQHIDACFLAQDLARQEFLLIQLGFDHARWLGREFLLIDPAL
jgi:hypothetical protein